jgi:hypothetical protein
MNMRSSWKKAAKGRLIAGGFAVSLLSVLGAAAPALAQERLEQDFGLIKACAGDVWSLCSDVLPDIGRMKECMQSKIGQLPRPCLDKLLDSMAGSSFKICKDQTYALCAAARCNVYDGVAYCQCEEKHGDSISLPFPMRKAVDVCAVNAGGADNKFMVSTYSLPEQIASPQGGSGVYTCEGGRSGGAYAQCDAGYASAAPRRRRSRASTSPYQKARSSVPARSPRRVPAARRAIRSSGRTRATSRSSNIARATLRTARRVRPSMSAPRSARRRA